MANILIVEDMKVQAQLLAYHLDELGHKHRTASDGRAALDALRDFTPDLIISDVEMPVMDGLALCERLKSSSDHKTIPVILLTAADSPTDVLRGIDVMADGYLTKPYDATLLEQVIDNAIERGAVAADSTDPREPIKFTYEGEEHSILASPRQMLNLFLSAYRSSVAQNKLLAEKERNLTELNDKLSRSIEQLSASEERFRGLVQTIPDIVYKVNGEGKFTFINDAIHRLGYHQSDLLGKHFSTIIYDDDLENISADIVLPRIRAGAAAAGGPPEGAGNPPKLFDERRSADRMTIGLQVRLKTRGGAPGGPVEIQAIGNQVIYVEVNSLGMYGDEDGDTSVGSAARQYIGSVGVIRDISERVQAQNAMRMAKEAADVANQAKSEFLSSMSHELRTPLNAIMGFGQLLDDPSNPLNEEQMNGLGHILEAGEHLLGLISEILDLAKIEAGRFHISLEKVEPQSAIEQCLLMTATLAERFDIGVVNNVKGGTVPWVKTDLTRFKQVLINLLSNAIKYNNPGGAATVDWEDTGEGFLRIAVADNGPGIPLDKQGLLFQPFKRLGKEASAIEGTGIGLSISRELMTRMEGNIGFTSEEGKGSRFWIELPIAGSFDQESIIERSQEDISDLVGLTDNSFDTEKSVLYIEDNPANMQLMRRVFRRLPQCELLSAADAERGLAMIAEKRPDLVLMDLNLPGMSGLQALGHLRAQTTTRDLPVVAVTAAAMNVDRTEGLESGFVDYITKPFNVVDIVRTVLRVLGDRTEKGSS